MKLVFLCSFSFCTLVVADKGEIFIGASSAPGFIWTQNPIDKNGQFSDKFVSPFSFNLRYGMTDTWHVGTDLSFLFGYGEFESKGARVESSNGDLYFNLLMIQAPLVLSYRFDSGYDYSFIFELNGGYSASIFSNRFLLQNDRLALAEDELKQHTAHGYTAGAQILFQMRFFDWMIVEVGPQYQVTYADGWNHFAGLVIRPSGALGIGSFGGVQ